MSRLAGLRLPIVACAALGCAATCMQALADEAPIALPIYEVSVPSHSGMAPEQARLATVETSHRAVAERPAFELRRGNPRFAMIELPAEATPPGTRYRRPHHALGYRWNAAESWLRNHGIEAQTCYLPMVRLHTKFSANGPSGTLWVYGRCSFK
jgi:hypothetical protein